MDGIQKLVVALTSLGTLLFLGGITLEFVNPELSKHLFKYSSLSFVVMYLTILTSKEKGD